MLFVPCSSSARKADDIGLGVTYTRLIGSQPMGVKKEVTNVELFYTFQVTPWMGLRPDIQYFDHPGDHRKNGLAMGVRGIIQL